MLVAVGLLDGVGVRVSVLVGDGVALAVGVAPDAQLTVLVLDGALSPPAFTAVT